MGKKVQLSLAAVLFCSIGLSLGMVHPFRSRRAPDETILDYQVITPSIVSTDRHEPHPNTMVVRVLSGDEDFILSMERNERLISPSLTSKSKGRDGRIIHQLIENCYYHGKVQGHPHWSVVMSTCKGLSGSFGDYGDKKELYHIEPLGDRSVTVEQPHVLYLATQHKDRESSCGAPHGHRHRNNSSSIDSVGELHKNGRVRRLSSNGFQIVELAIVNDYVQYQQHNSDIAMVTDRAVSITNHIDALFHSLQVHVVLVDMVTWTSPDEGFSPVSNPNTLLTTFEQYLANNHNFKSDATMLLTGTDLDGTTAGIAYLGTLCNPLKSVGVTEDWTSSPQSVGAIAAHELGHIFDMEHDVSSCSCGDSGGCIMAAISSSPPPHLWSSCSASVVQSSSFTCLDNEPEVTVSDPQCGNDIIEEGEACDCGSPDSCQDKCCNPNTCQLADGAECAKGECCDTTCHFVPSGVQCRESAGECDVEEFCTGASFECPADTHKADGVSCKSGDGYCYFGTCPTRDEQCKNFYGQASGDGIFTSPFPLNCYTQYNTRSDVHGYCAHLGENSFTPCEPSNVECGALQCIAAGEEFPIGVSSVFYGTHGFTGQQCKSFATFALDTMEPGLVKDGTKCGNNKVCMDQVCTDLPEAAAATTAPPTAATTAPPTAAPTAPPNSCISRCGDYNAALSCQCDNLCQNYGDCCPNFSTDCPATK